MVVVRLGYDSEVTDEEIAIRILHAFVVHGGVASVDMDGHSVARGRVTGSANGV